MRLWGALHGCPNNAAGSRMYFFFFGVHIFIGACEDLDRILFSVPFRDADGRLQIYLHDALTAGDVVIAEGPLADPVHAHPGLFETRVDDDDELVSSPAADQ